MTVSTLINRYSYSGDGATTTFPFPSYFFNAGDLVVIQRLVITGSETTMVFNVDYTVSGAGVASGGTVTLVVPPAVGVTLTIYRDPIRTQNAVFAANDSLPAKSLGDGLDLLTMQTQRLSERLDRAVSLTEGSVAGIFNPKLPATIGPNLFLVTNSLGTGLALLAQTPITYNTLVFNPKDYGVVGAGDDSSAIQGAIAAAVSNGGGTISLPGRYTCLSSIAISNDYVKLLGEGPNAKISFADGKGFLVTGNYFTAQNLQIDGGSLTGTAGSLISVKGADAGHKVTGIRILDCRLTNATFYGIYVENAKDVQVDRNTIDNVFYAGISLLSVEDFTCDENHVLNILGSNAGNAYGISVSEVTTRASSTATTSTTSKTVTALASSTGVIVGQEVDGPNFAPDTQVLTISGTSFTVNRFPAISGNAAVYFSDPVSKTGSVSNNVVFNNPTWEGIDTHSGKDITISGNQVHDCYIGIGCGSSGTSLRRAPKRVIIANNGIKGFNKFDDTKTVTGTGTAMTLSAAPNFTVVVGDYLAVGSEGRQITVVGSQTSFTLLSAFSVDPSTATANVTQKGRSAYGVTLVGVSGASQALPFDTADGCSILNNSIINHGAEVDALGTAIYTYNTTGLTIASNRIIEPNQYGIFVYFSSFGISIANNTIIDPWSFSKSDPSAFRFYNDYLYGSVVGNVSKRGTLIFAPWVLQRHFFWGTSLTHIDMFLSDNFYDGPNANYFVNPPTGINSGTLGIKGNSPKIRFTPTGTWVANTTYTGLYWLEGASIKVWVKVACTGAPTAATLRIAHPSGFVPNPAGFPAAPDTSNLTSVLGLLTIFDSVGGLGNIFGRVNYHNFTDVALFVDQVASTYVTGTPVTQALPKVFGSNDTLEALYTLPI